MLRAPASDLHFEIAALLKRELGSLTQANPQLASSYLSLSLCSGGLGADESYITKVIAMTPFHWGLSLVLMGGVVAVKWWCGQEFEFQECFRSLSSAIMHSNLIIPLVIARAS